MRFQKLELRAFGPFTDTSLDFSTNPSAIQLIYGPNEAGKSTALRAVRALLFGIPVQTPDSFLHDNQALRIGAELKRSNGEQLAFIRRKGRANTLLDLEGNALADDALRPFLQGISESLFTSAFGLDHEILVKGGQDLAEGKGEIGEILFGAGLGLANLHDVLVKLESEMEDLFKQRGQVQLLNKALSEYKGAAKASRESILPSDEYLGLQNSLTQSRTDASGIQGTLTQKSAARSRLLRICRAIPLIARLNMALKERQAFGEVPILPPNFMERRITAQKERDTASYTCEALTQALHELETELAELVVPVAILDQSPAITELSEYLSVHLKADRDGRELETQAKQHRQDMQSAMQRLPEALRLASGEPPRVDVATKQRLLVLSGHAGKLEHASAAASQAVALHMRQLENLKEQQAHLAECRDTTNLQRALHRAQRLGEIEDRAELLQASISKNERLVATALRQATPAWEDSPDLFETAPIPLRETIERYEAELADRKDVLKEAKRDADRTRKVIHALGEELRVLQHGNPVPSEAELEHARNRRSALWGFVRRSWLDREDVTQEASGHIGERALETAYEDAVAEADGVADALWRDADRASQRASLEHRLKQTAEELCATDTTVNEAEAALSGFDDTWRALWVPLPLIPLPPREMLAWLVKREEILGLIEQTHNDTAELKRIQVQIVDEEAALRQGIAEVGSNPPTESIGLRELIEIAQDLITTNAELDSQRRTLAQRIDDARHALLNTEQEAQDAEAALASWQKEWSEAVQSLNLASNVRPEEVTAILGALDDYFLKAQEWASKHQRIQEIRDDASAFKEQVKKLVSNLNVGLAELPLELAVRTLHEQLQAAKELQRDQRLKHDQCDAKRTELIDSAAKKKAAEEELNRLCLEARCQHPEELPAVENAARNVAALRQSITELQQQLGEHAGGLPLDAFIEDVSKEDPDALPGQVVELDQEIARLEAERENVLKQIGGFEADLSRMNGASRAIEEAQRAESHVAEVNDIAWRYARLRIATAVLRQAMDRYRQTAQGPVLGRASNAFARITAGSFTELRTGFDLRDQQVIQGVRSGGALLGVDEMSEGTRDQLYLALRIGTLEHYLTQNESMPLILDDILVNFDDERAAATLQVLAEVAQSTQVLFFTHHQHLVDIARAMLPAEAFTLHRLDRQSANAPAP